MKKRKHIIITLAIIFALSATILLIPKKGSYADFGDFSGDSDYGGSDWSSSDYDSSDWDWDNDDDDYDYGYSSSSRHSSGSSSMSIPSVFIIFVLFMIGYVIAKNRKTNTNSSTMSTQNTPVTVTTSQDSSSFDSLIAKDPNFSIEEMKTKISNLYIQFQQAWEKKDISSLRPYLTDVAFAQYDRQLNNYRKNQETNKIEHPTVLSVTLTGWHQENNKDVIIARLNTRIIDYVISDKTGEIVKGNKREKFMEYEWTLERSSSVQTTTENGAAVQKCPNCGGAVNINQTAKCPYCRHLITTDKFNWQVREIKGISQRTA